MSASRLPNRSRRLAWAALSALFCGAVALACDTPVYQYTIENWERDPYLVCYFHKGGEAPADAKTNDYLRRVSSGQVEHANLSFASVDVSSPGAPASPVQRRIWEGRGSRQAPFHAIISPKGHEVFAGKLTEADARALVSSPGRTRLAEELARGTHGALLLVTGSNQAENAAARETLSAVIRTTREEGREVGAVEVRRDDPAEAWLIRQVLLLESDLRDLDNTMIFPIFGRGHALEPYLGKGITERNLNEVVAFMNGPCACEIKSASIGMDLLTNFDWTARQVAGGTATAPSFALFDIEEAPATEPTCTMPTAPRNTAAPPDQSADVEPDRVPTANAGDGGGTGADLPPAEAEPVDTIPTMSGDDGGSSGAGSASAAFPGTAGTAAVLPPAAVPASDQRALTSGPDLVAASRPMPADLAAVEGTAPLATKLSLVLGLTIAGGTLAVLLVGTFIILRPRGQRVMPDR